MKVLKESLLWRVRSIIIKLPMLTLTPQRAIFSLPEISCHWQCMEDTVLNTPLDLWRFQWSSGRRMTPTEEWVLLCFQSIVQLAQGACVLQHLWSLSAPRVKERNTLTMGVTKCFYILMRICSLSLLTSPKHILYQSLLGLLKHYQVIMLFTKDNAKGTKGEERSGKKPLKRRSDQ